MCKMMILKIVLLTIMYLVGQLEVHSNMHTCDNVKYCIFMKRKEKEKKPKSR